MGLREIGCEDGRWMELAHNHIQLRSLVLAVLNLQVLLPETSVSHSMSQMIWSSYRIKSVKGLVMFCPTCLRSVPSECSTYS
jgi:hypothetical protein